MRGVSFAHARALSGQVASRGRTWARASLSAGYTFRSTAVSTEQPWRSMQAAGQQCAAQSVCAFFCRGRHYRLIWIAVHPVRRDSGGGALPSIMP